MIKRHLILVASACALFAAAPALAQGDKASRAAAPTTSARAAELLREYEKAAGKPIVVQEKDSDGAIKIGEDDIGSGGRPAPQLQPQVDSLKTRIADLEAKLAAAINDLNAAKGEISAAKTEAATLKKQFDSHRHEYAAGTNYQAVAIHGHPAWDVPTKYCSQITGGMGYSTEWSTSQPKF